MKHVELTSEELHWLRQLDAAQGDASNRVEVGISTGPAGKDWTIEDIIPDGAISLGVVYVGAGQTQALDDDLCDGQDYAQRRGLPQGLAHGSQEWLNQTNARKVRKG